MRKKAEFFNSSKTMRASTGKKTMINRPKTELREK